MTENLDNEITETTAKIHAALRDPAAASYQKQELGRESIRLLSKKIVGGQ